MPDPVQDLNARVAELVQLYKQGLLSEANLRAALALNRTGGV